MTTVDNATGDSDQAMTGHDYATPFIDILPPLRSDEFTALRQDIEVNGQQVPIIVTPDGCVIDGHHRLRVCRELGLVPLVRVVDTAYPKGMAIKMNLIRRNLSPDQQSEVRHQQQKLAAEMAQDGMTQAQIGEALGVAQQTISLWTETFTNAGKGFRPDNRVKIPKGAREDIAQRIDAGESLAQVAADYNVTHTAIRKTVNKVKAAEEEAQARQADADTIQPDAEGDRWKMLHGDFRDRLADLPDGSVDLIVTDPPYPAEFLPLWSDLSQVAARILKPGGVLLAMSGKIHLDDVMARLGEHLSYGWIYMLPLERGLTRINARNLLQGWKPWLAYSAGAWPSGSIEFADDRIDSGYREKSRYRWEQDPIGALRLLEIFDPQARGIIVDPFTGTGSFGVAALKHGSRFIGVELDSGRFDGTVARLNEGTGDGDQP